jgi:hypothetical protein
MNKKKIMEELLEENRQINRNIVHLGNLTGLLILMEGMKEAKRERNKGVLTLLKPALFLVMLIELFLTAMNICEIAEKFREKRAEIEEEEF